MRGARAIPPLGFPLKLVGRCNLAALLMSTRELAAASTFPLRPSGGQLLSSLVPFHLQVLSCGQSFAAV